MDSHGDAVMLAIGIGGAGDLPTHLSVPFPPIQALLSRFTRCLWCTATRFKQIARTLRLAPVMPSRDTEPGPLASLRGGGVVGQSGGPPRTACAPPTLGDRDRPEAG